MKENTIWYTAGISRLVANSATIVQFSNDFSEGKIPVIKTNHSLSVCTCSVAFDILLALFPLL